MTARYKARTTQKSDWQQQELRRRRLMLALWIVAGVGFVAMLVYLVWKEAQPAPRPGVEVPIQGQDHIAIGVPHDPYNSDPPTSGPHYESAADAGFYNEAPPDEYLVHNLEHGHVILWYNCTQLSPEACEELKSQINEVMQRAGVSTITGTLKLVAVPRPSMDNVLTLTSWGRLLKLEAFDRDEVLTFIRVYRDQAPEPGAA
jgi:Protein of unknown function (DUF3105)